MALSDLTDLREVPVDWRGLENAVENNAPDVNSYLHLVSGAVLRVVDGVAKAEVQARISGGDEYVRVDPVNSREQYHWMAQFIPTVGGAELRESLSYSIEGAGAFRRFKAALLPCPDERERWFGFRGERLRAFMEAWLTARGITPIEERAPQSGIRELRPRIEMAPRKWVKKTSGVGFPQEPAERRSPSVTDEEDELVLERIVATVHAKHGSTAEQLAHRLGLGEADAFEYLSELVISERLGMVDGRYYPVGATASANVWGAGR